MIAFLRPGSAELPGVCAFVAPQVDSRGYNPATTAALVKLERDRLVGAWLFHDYDPDAGTICMSAAGEKGWLTLEIIYKAHSYAFDDAGCQMVVLDVSERNDMMCRTATHFGYKAHRIPRLRGREEASIVFTLTEEDWRASKFTQRAQRAIIRGSAC